ncbi:MAG: sigma-54 dependent transcriptional regulator [Gammaproteobacteria bacterium]|jgi:DNA-binding NtrC family response regulator
MMTTAALVVDRNRARRQRLTSELARRLGFAEGASSLSRARRLMERCRFDCLVVDLDAGDGSTLEWVSDLRQTSDQCSIILTCDTDQAKQAISALRFGVAEIMLRPFEPNSLLSAIQRVGGAGAAPTASAVPRGFPAGTDGDANLVGNSEAISAVRKLIRKVAPTSATVLIEGETGTGKDAVARLLHQQSGRRGAFVTLNCGATEPELLASELFGHAKGTSARSNPGRDGLFVAARGGTLFLDEVADIPVEVAAKLLRALEESAIRPVGSSRKLHVDVRVVASTQSDLAEHARRRQFRKDLFYALSVVHVKLPPLRERPGDIEDLARLFMDSLAGGLGLAPMPLDPERIRQLQEHDWPGNARELRSFIERVLMLGEFPSEPLQSSGHISGSGPFGYPEDWPLERVKTDHMKRVLAACDDNRSRAARRLGVSRKTLERKLGPRRE